MIQVKDKKFHPKSQNDRRALIPMPAKTFTESIPSYYKLLNNSFDSS